MKLEGQVAIVTGAGRNIGERIAEVLAGEGARIAVVDLDRARAQQAARNLADAGREAEAFVADVSDNDAVRSLVAAVVERFGRIDILVNNVAISDNRHVLEITEQEWDDTIRVTLKSPFLMAKHVAHHMVDNGIAGKIVNIGSTSGYRGRGSACAYSAAKGGVANLTRSLAFQLAPHGIRVNSVSPNRTGSPGRHSGGRSEPLLQEPGQPRRRAGRHRAGRGVPLHRGRELHLRREHLRRRRGDGDGGKLTEDFPQAAGPTPPRDRRFSTRLP